MAVVIEQSSVRVRVIVSGVAANAPLSMARAQWRGELRSEMVALALSDEHDSAAVPMLDIVEAGVLPAESELTDAWLQAQLACDRTEVGALLGVSVLLVPSKRRWRIAVLVPLLGLAFPSGKLADSPVTALRSAHRRLSRQQGR
jgi:hypothetical protein